MAHGAISGSRSVVGGVSARSELVVLLLEQVVVPVKLLPLCVHVEHRCRAMMMAGSGQFEQES